MLTALLADPDGLDGYPGSSPSAPPLAVPAAALDLLAREWRELAPAFAAEAAKFAAPGSSPEALETGAATLAAWLEPLARALAVLGMEAGGQIVAAVLANLDADPALAGPLTDWAGHFGTWLDRPDHPDTAAALVAALQDQRWPYPLPAAEAAPLQAGLERIRIAAVSPVEPPAAAFTPADLSLAIPEAVNRDLLDTLLDVLPRQSAEFSAALRRIAELGRLDDIRTAQRIAHTLKGSGHLVGIRGIATLTHALEDILEALYQRKATPGAELAALLQEAGDCLEAMGDALTGSAPAPAEGWTLLQAVAAWSRRIAEQGLPPDAVPALDTTPPTADIPAEPDADASEASLRVPAERIRELFRQTGETLILGGQLREQLAQASALSRAQEQLQRQIEQLLVEQETLVDIRGAGLPARERGGGADGFDPLELEPYHELHSLTHRLLEAAADARDLGRALKSRLAELETILARQDRQHRETRADLLRTRWVPARGIFARCQRCVRQTGRLTGKPVDLAITGGDTLVDSEILDRLADPLMHVLRNAVDHGIEPAATRTAAGKPATGQIRLEFARQGHLIMVRVEDDGAGLDLARIRRTAEAKGLIPPGQDLPDRDLPALTLLPGFSTRDTASQVSGRGVGLDAVQGAVQALNGQVELDSRPGQGCAVAIKLPMAWLSTHVLLVRGRQRYALAPTGIDRILPPGAGILDPDGDGLVYTLEGERHPAVFLESLLGWPVPTPAPGPGAPPVVLVAERSGPARAVLLPPEVLGWREVVVKSLGPYVPGLPGVVGAAILGDGGLAAVLDLPELARAGERRRLPRWLMDAAGALPQDGAARLPRALVVDDSLSARRALAQTLGDAGYEVRTAIDGREALDILPGFRPDILLTDLEMPRLNGIELAAHVRMRAEYRELPVVMMTSRATDKHRREAGRAGVDLYLTKPYVEEELLRALRGLLDDQAYGRVR